MNIREIQAPIRERYTKNPNEAQIVLTVRGGSGDLSDPLHSVAKPDSVHGTEWRSGAHEAVGGAGDAPCSGDLLLGALVACQEITLRMVAANMGVEIEKLEVTAEADWDARGTLVMGDYPVGLKAIRCNTSVVVPSEVKADRAERLLRSAEKHCVVLNTLREGVDVESNFALEQA